MHEFKQLFPGVPIEVRPSPHPIVVAHLDQGSLATWGLTRELSMWDTTEDVVVVKGLDCLTHGSDYPVLPQLWGTPKNNHA